MKRRPSALLAVLLLLLLAHAPLGLAASNRAHRQIAFSDPALAASPTSEPTDERQWHAHANAALVDDDDPAPVAALRLSHAGLYINQAHAPSLIHRPDHDNVSHAFQPHPLVVHMDPALYSTGSASASIGPVRLRTRDQVMLHCGNDVGGIESCEYDDLHPSSRPIESHIEFEQADALDCRATPLSVAADGAFFLDQRSCPGWNKYWGAVELARSTSPHELLQSFVVTINVAKLPPASATSQYETHRFWIGQLHLEQSRASWPLAGNARDRRPGQDDRTWHPRDVNRIAGAMENPMIPKSSRFTNDRNYGVYVDQSSWTLGVQIKIPLSITNPRDDDDDEDDDDEEGSVHANMMLPPEEVFAPVSGQVVWARDYTFRRPPLFGPAAGANDEASFCVMVRDEWSIVYQIFGLDAGTVGVREGDTVLRGDVLGHALREGVSVEPPSTEPPADHAPSKPDDEVSFYPHRYRTLEVRVARPDPKWSEWKHPDESGWQYFHPLHVFTEGNSYRSSITPYGSPTIIYFSKPSVDPLNTPPNAYATSTDFWTPTLQGPTEIIVGFEYFQQTPGDPADGMENLAIYALDVGIRKKRAGEREAARGMECDLGGDTDPSGTDDKDRAYWRTVFEHAKLPNNWTPSVEGGSEYGWRSKLFSHYMPAFSHGRFFPEKITSQFDDKERRLYYSASRTVRGEPKLGGALNVQSIIERDGDEGGRGKYRLVVRARDYWGNVGCLASDVLLA